MEQIYIVEDNELIREGVKEYLEVNGYAVESFYNLSELHEAVTYKKPDVLIIDVMLPDGNGFQYAKKLREKSQVPIVFLTAKEQESDRILGFEVGGDDYIVKPFSNKELLMRIKVQLKRSKPSRQKIDTKEVEKYKLEQHLLSIDKKARKAFINENIVTLTASEWKLLVFLSRHWGQAISREMLLGECLGYLHGGSERTVDTHIANLRSQLGKSNWIGTVRSFGYRFNGVPINEDHRE